MIRIWYRDSDNTDMVFDVPGRCVEEYSKDMQWIPNADGLPQGIHRRADKERAVIGLKMMFPPGYYTYYEIDLTSNARSVAGAVSDTAGGAITNGVYYYTVIPQYCRVHGALDLVNAQSAAVTLSGSNDTVVLSWSKAAGTETPDYWHVYRSTIEDTYTAADYIGSVTGAVGLSAGYTDTAAAASTGRTPATEAVLTLKDYLNDAFRNCRELLIFDSDDQRYYLCSLDDFDDELAANDVIYKSASDTVLEFVVTEHGEYTDFDDPTSTTEIER